MTINRRWMFGSILLSLFALVALATLVPQTAANAPQGEISAYLPFIAAQPRPPMGIYGRVTENTLPAAGITLDLRFFNGSSWSTAASLATDANGEYHFFDMPGLAPGQRYAAVYNNPEDNTNRVAGWVGIYIASYPVVGADAFGGDIDITNIHLISPGPSAVGLPTTFTWSLRPFPTESYEFNLYDYTSGDPWFYTDPPLGYVNSYTLSGLPPGFQYYTTYVWSVWAYGAGGSTSTGNYGLSYWASGVGFVETAAGAQMVTLPNAQVRNSLVLSPEMER